MTLPRLAACAAILLLGSCGTGSGIPSSSEVKAFLSLPDYVGPVCGDPSILGTEITRIKGPGRCGIEEPVRVYAVAGVALNPGARMKCETAAALKTWINDGARPAARKAGAEIKSLRVAADYACRGRNNKRGARLSEHGKGNAIDISAVGFTNGEVATILSDWRKGPYSKPLKAMHKAACGPFGTTLGPGSDGYHEDHLHFDIADHRNGPYCR